MTPDQFASVLAACEHALSAVSERDWSVPAGTLEWSCWQTVDHVVDCVFSYALQVAARARSGFLPFGELPANAEASNLDLLLGARRSPQRVEGDRSTRAGIGHPVRVQPDGSTARYSRAERSGRLPAIRSDGVGAHPGISQPWRRCLDLGADSKVYRRLMAQTISFLADELGVSTDTLRYYERLELLRPAGRTPAGYRLYDERAAERLRFIRGAQRMGLRLGDIKELLDIKDRGQCPCGHTSTLVKRRLAEVNAELLELAALKRQLLELQRRNDECADASAGAWTCAIGIDEGGEA